MVIRTPPETPGNEETNSLEDSGYDILSDVVTLTSEDENDGTTVSLASYDGDTPDDLSSDAGSDGSQNDDHHDHALQFGSTISGADSGLTMTGRPVDRYCNIPTSASAYDSYKRSRWWQFNGAANVANVPSATRLLIDDKIRPRLRKIKRFASLQTLITGVLLMLSILSTIWISMSQAGYQWSDGSLRCSKTQPELLRRNAALDSAVSSMAPKSPISLPKLINSAPQFRRPRNAHDAQESWVKPSPHPLSPEANESDKFQLQVLGCCNLIVTSPFRSYQPASYQQINIEVERTGEPISFELLHLVEGVKAVTLDAEEAHGDLQVKVWTLSRPYVNQTMTINMGSPLYKIASWKSFFVTNSHKAKNTLLAAADLTLQNMNALADDAKTVQAKLADTFHKKSPYVVASLQRYQENGASLTERAFKSTATMFRDFRHATELASKQGQTRTTVLGELLLSKAQALMLELQARARSYQKQARPVNGLVRTGMRSSVVKRARSQAVDLWGRIRHFGGRPIAARIGTSLGNLNASSLMPWRDYGFSISRRIQCSSSSSSSSSKRGRAWKEGRSEWFTDRRGNARCEKKEVLANSGARGVLRL